MASGFLFKALHRGLLQPIHRQFRGMTLGTRTAVIDGENQVLLVRHSYAPGWMLPGGGVERGETLAEAALREIREEAGIETAAEPMLHGILLNDAQFPGDHVACFVVRRFRQLPIRKSLEIAEVRFSPAQNLPEATTAGTRRRIAEIMAGQPAAAHW